MATSPSSSPALQSGVLSVFLLDTGNPVAMAECRRCPFWTFRWTPRLIQHTGCKTITKCGPRGWETATGYRCLARSWHLLVGWCRAAHRDAHVATVPSTQARPSSRLHQAARPRRRGAVAVTAALAANPARERPDQASIDPEC